MINAGGGGGGIVPLWVWWKGLLKPHTTLKITIESL